LKSIDGEHRCESQTCDPERALARYPGIL